MHYPQFPSSVTTEKLMLVFFELIIYVYVFFNWQAKKEAKELLRGLWMFTLEESG